MSTRSPTRSRWIDRIAGAAVGAGVMAILLRADEGDAPAPIPTADAEAAAGARADTGAAAAAVAGAEMGTRAGAGAQLQPEAPPEPEPEPEPEPVREAEAEGVETSAGAAASALPPSTPAPKIPLSRLPGTRTLRTSERFDAEIPAWVLTHSLQVPAGAAQVESFYRKALEDAGLNVSAFVEPVTDRWAVRVTVRGRGRKDKVQVSIRQPSGEMRTTARIIWERSV